MYEQSLVYRSNKNKDNEWVIAYRKLISRALSIRRFT